MLVIPVYPLVLVGIIVVALFSFAIWLMCYETVVNRKLISAASASNSSSPNGASSRSQRLIRGRTRQQTTGTVSASSACLRASAGTPYNSRTVRGDVTSTNAGIRNTSGTPYSTRTVHNGVTSTNAGIRNVIGNPYNSRTVRCDVTSTNANLHNTTDRNTRATPVTPTQGNHVTGEDMPSNISIGQNNLVFERDEPRPVHGGVIGLPSYSEVVNSRPDPDFDAPPRYEDLLDLPNTSK